MVVVPAPAFRVGFAVSLSGSGWSITAWLLSVYEVRYYLHMRPGGWPSCPHMCSWAVRQGSGPVRVIDNLGSSFVRLIGPCTAWDIVCNILLSGLRARVSQPGCAAAGPSLRMLLCMHLDLWWQGGGSGPEGTVAVSVAHAHIVHV